MLIEARCVFYGGYVGERSVVPQRGKMRKAEKLEIFQLPRYLPRLGFQEHPVSRDSNATLVARHLPGHIRTSRLPEKDGDTKSHVQHRFNLEIPSCCILSPYAFQIGTKKEPEAWSELLPSLTKMILLLLLPIWGEPPRMSGHLLFSLVWGFWWSFAGVGMWELDGLLHIWGAILTRNHPLDIIMGFWFKFKAGSNCRGYLGQPLYFTVKETETQGS